MHGGQRVEAHPLKITGSGLDDDSLGQRASDPVAAKLRADVQALHLAHSQFYGVQSHAACQFAVPMRGEDRVVVAGQRGDLALEVLEGEVDLERAGVFEEEFPHRSDVDRGMDVKH